MESLICQAQNYAWGKVGQESSVYRHKKAGDGEAFVGDDTDRYAELWTGTHPKGHSIISRTGQQLQDFLKENSDAYLGGQHTAHFGADLPFIVKILSVEKALSIQAHPDKKNAARLHARDPGHYPDDNHKPELVVALTDYIALCCFRKVDQVLQFLDAIPPLTGLAGEGVRELFLEAQQESEEKGKKEKAALQTLLKSLINLSAEEVEGGCRKIAEWECPAGVESGLKESIAECLKLFHHISKDFPNDVGLFFVFVLNILHLKPGHGLFLDANEPHAYISGDSVEIMARSDNVVRAGLTPKFQDKETLVDMLTYCTKGLEGDPKLIYRMPADTSRFEYMPRNPAVNEFKLTRLAIAPEKVVEHSMTTVGTIYIIRGSVEWECLESKLAPAHSSLKGDTRALRQGYTGLVASGLCFRLKNNGEEEASVFISETGLTPVHCALDLESCN